MPASHVNDSKHWRDRGAQMRALSEMMKDIDAATIMLRLAAHSSDRDQSFQAMVITVSMGS